MTQRGLHTWDIIIDYHACPKCGYIQENRERYEERFDQLIKDLICERCQSRYFVEKNEKKKFAPFFGEPTAPEFDWD